MFDVLSKLNLSELQQLQLFTGVDPETVKGIVGSCVIRRLKKHELLFVPDQPNQYLYQVLSGRLSVHLESPDSDPVSLINPGEPVGELSILDSSMTSAFVVADEDSRLLVLDESHVWSLVEASHAFARNLLLGLTRRLRNANKVILEKMQQENFYYHYGMVDLLTGMHTRIWFEHVISRAMRRCTMQDKPFSLILADIDDFRIFNEKNGRLSGDMALGRIAQTIKEHLRVTELSVRYEGDRMLVILPETDIRQARMVGERLRKKIMYTDILAADGRVLPSVTISVGIAQARTDQTPEGLVEVLLVALKRAKEMGKNYVSD